MVAREGEPPTRGFSARFRRYQGFINQPLAATCRPLLRHTKAQSWHTRSELVTPPSQHPFVDRVAPRSIKARRTLMASLPRPFRLPKRRSAFRAYAPLLGQYVRHAASHDRHRRQSFQASLAAYVESSWSALQQSRFGFGILIYCPMIR
jgi:hypothetical protein